MLKRKQKIADVGSFISSKVQIEVNENIDENTLRQGDMGTIHSTHSTYNSDSLRSVYLFYCYDAEQLRGKRGGKKEI